MLVTAAVFHLERSALNAEADLNAVGGWRWTQSKKKENGKGKKREERREDDERRSDWAAVDTR